MLSGTLRLLLMGLEISFSADGLAARTAQFDSVFHTLRSAKARSLLMALEGVFSGEGLAASTLQLDPALLTIRSAMFRLSCR